MNSDNAVEVRQGIRPSSDDMFYFRWGRETLKGNLTLANEVLRQLVTLNSALLGGSIAFLDEAVVDASFKPWIVGAFTISLILSFVGMMPYEALVDLRVPEEVRRHKELAFKSKRRYLWSAGVCLAAGFGLAIAGMLVLYLK
jgi:hypothetical protein